jgi:hypothetical protein
MSERMKEIVDRARAAQDFRWIFPELLEAIEALAAEVDALRARRFGAAEPAPAPAPAPALPTPCSNCAGLRYAVNVFLSRVLVKYGEQPGWPDGATVFNTKDVAALRFQLDALEPAPVPAAAWSEHEAAVAQLHKRRFEWVVQVGDVTSSPSDRHLARAGGVDGLGWIEISGEPGLVGPVVMHVDGSFPLRFPSLVDLVAHLEDES